MGQCAAFSCVPCCRNIVSSVCDKINPEVIEPIVALKEPIFDIALKAPNSFNYQYTSSYNKKWIFDEDVNIWIKQLYHKRGYTQWLLYNDQVNFEPHKDQEYIDLISTSNDGHCKGILAWNDKNISWLAHSVPDFPQTFDGKNISEIPKSKIIYGQSFICVTMPYSEVIIKNIQNQLHIMHANMFISNCYDEYKQQFKKENREIKKTIKINDNIQHVAKSKKFGEDLYENYLMKEFCGKHDDKNDHCVCQTWIRGHKYPESKTVKNVKSIKWNSNSGLTDIEYNLNKDHSKWCLSQMKHIKWVYMGDINRMTSQKTRGGGGFVVVDDDLHKLFNNMCIMD